VDYAEIIVAAFTLALIICLFVFILFVGTRLRKFVGEGDRTDLQNEVDGKLKNLRVILLGVGLMVVFLIMRFVVVALRNFVTSVMLGYVVFYDIGEWRRKKKEKQID